MDKVSEELMEKFRVQRLRNVALLTANAKMIAKNERWLKRWRWLGFLMGDLRYQTDRLIRADSTLREIDTHYDQWLGDYGR